MVLAERDLRSPARVSKLPGNVEELPRNVARPSSRLAPRPATSCSRSAAIAPAISSGIATSRATMPRCPKCGATLRPDVVFFGEGIPALPGWTIKRALRGLRSFHRHRHVWACVASCQLCKRSRVRWRADCPCQSGADGDPESRVQGAILCQGRRSPPSTARHGCLNLRS